MQRIGIIGLGLLGSAVAARLLQRGFDVSGYDIRAEQVAALGRQGLRPATSIVAVAEEADAIFTILPTLESVEAVFCGPHGLVDTAPRHTILMQMSTISPALTQRLAEAAAARGRRFLDTPISGTSAMVAQGDCTLLVGGAAATVQTCRPIFDAIARRTVHVGDIGTASLAKLVTNLLVALNTAALAEALVLAAKGGLAPATMLDALSDSAASSRMLDVRGPLMVVGEFPPQMKLDLFLKVCASCWRKDSVLQYLCRSPVRHRSYTQRLLRPGQALTISPWSCGDSSNWLACRLPRAEGYHCVSDNYSLQEV